MLNFISYNYTYKPTKYSCSTNHHLPLLLTATYSQPCSHSSATSEVQNMYGKGGQRVCKADLRPPEVDPYFERKKISLGGVTKNYQATILIVEQNPPERKFLTYIKIFSQEDFALRSKLWPNNFSEHRPIFAGNSRSTGISQLRAGKTRSKRPRSHCLSTLHI